MCLELMKKMDRLALSQEFTILNAKLQLYSRKECGFVESMSHLIQAALLKDTVQPEKLAQLAESISIKLLSSPLS
jgi:hypothetical protein